MSAIPNPAGQSAREVIYATLTSPPLTYLEDQGGGAGYITKTLPASSVLPRSVWIDGSPNPPPAPYVSFAVRSSGMSSRFIDDRKLTITFWVVGDNEDQIEWLYEAIRSRVNLGDQDAGPFTSDMSRVGSSTQMGAVFRECIERAAYPTDFDKMTARWLKVAEYDAIVQ